MVTSTPPLQQQGGSSSSSNQNPNGSVGFQPNQQNPVINPFLLMRLHQQQQQQQLRMSQPQIMPNQLQLLMMLMQKQQEHGTAAAMLNSPIPNSDLSFQASTPLVNTDSSTSSGHLSSFLSPPQQSPFASGTPNSTNAAGQQQSDSFQMPLSVLNNTSGQMATKPQRRRNRPGGPSVKTAEVWRFFTSKSPPEQAATCNICQKTIKATNSSTTGMIRHLRSCHREEHIVLEEARNRNQIIKTFSSCADEKSREKLLNALKNGQYNPQQSSVTSTSHLADSSTASSVSPNSTASSAVLLRNASAMHSVDSLLVENASVASSVLGADGEEMEEERKVQSNQSKPLASSVVQFPSPEKYLQTIKSQLTEVEHNAKKNAIEQQNENRPLNEEELLDEDEDEEQDEDVENLAVTEEDSEEDASIMPKRQKLNDNTAKETHEFRGGEQKPMKQSAEGVERIIALMLLLDELSPEIVDQPGFRFLFSHLAPTYTLPSAADFKSRIIPQVRSQLPNGDISVYRQRVMENNRFHQPTTSSSSSSHPQWPISPSTTAESGFEEFIDVLSETASSASLHIVEQSIRSAQNISQSFGYSTTPLTSRSIMAKKPKLEVMDKEVKNGGGEEKVVKQEE